MCLDDLFYNGKTKTGTTFIFASGKIRLVKAVPDLFNAVSGNTDACIFYGDKDLLVFAGCLDVDHRVIMAELDGIVDQVIKDLLDLAHVCVDHLDVIGKCKVKADMSGVTGSFKGCGSVFITRLISKLVLDKNPFASKEFKVSMLSVSL